MHELRLILLTMLFLGLAVLLAFTVAQSIRKGVVLLKGGRKCLRSKQPACYWTVLVISISIACISVLAWVDLVLRKELLSKTSRISNACAESVHRIVPVVLAQMKYAPSAVQPDVHKKGIYELIIGPTGTIDKVIVAKPSGDPALDDLARNVLLNTPGKLSGCIDEGRYLMALTF